MIELLQQLPVQLILAALVGALVAWLLLRPVRLPADPIQEEIRELERQAEKLERMGDSASSDDRERLTRLHTILRRRRNR